MKARSSLNLNLLAGTLPDSALSHPALSNSPPGALDLNPASRQKRSLGFGSKDSSIFMLYLKRWRTLLVGLFLWGWLFHILSRVSPSGMQTIFFPEWYVPFQFLFFIANWFILSFIFLHARRGFLLAIAIQSLLIFRLLRVTLDAKTLLSISVFFVIIELLAGFMERISQNPRQTDANLNQKSFRRRRRTTPRSILFPTG